MSKKAEYAKGMELGTAAFNAGKMAVPVRDKTLMDHIASLGERPVGSSIQLLSGWTKGWHAANAAAAIR